MTIKLGRIRMPARIVAKRNGGFFLVRTRTGMRIVHQTEIRKR